MNEEKKKVRSLVAKRLSSVSAVDLARMSREIRAVVAGSPLYGRAEAVFCYNPMGREVDFLPLLRDALAAGKTVALPRIHGKQIRFHKIESLDAPMDRHSFGILEPPETAPEVKPAGREKTLVLVPGAAFDASMGRLGRGGGFYDAYLAGYRGALTAVGTCFSLQLVAVIPMDPWDIRMDLIVTEQGYLGRG